MPRPTPGASQLAPCPLASDSGPDAALKYLVWKEATGWVVVYGTPKVWSLVASGLPCWHCARDAAGRRWLRFWDGGPGWSTPVLRVGMPLVLGDGQTVCDTCWGDLAGGAR